MLNNLDLYKKYVQLYCGLIAVECLIVGGLVVVTFNQMGLL